LTCPAPKGPAGGDLSPAMQINEEHCDMLTGSSIYGQAEQI